MHISDMLRQYNKNVSNSTEELRSAQGTQKLVSTVSELSAGSVFEGTVNAVKGGKVILALGNGQVIAARLEGKVDMKPGMAMFFQVKANDGLTVSIRPYNGTGNASNPILLNALTAAQVPVTDRMLAMVDTMMQEQMPIDKQSIMEMVKILTANPQANVQTIVQMTKLGLPVTEEMAVQFEQYLSGQHEMLDKLGLATNQMVEMLGEESTSPEDAFTLYSKMVELFVPQEKSGESVTSLQGQLAKIATGTEVNDIKVPDESLENVLSNEQLETLTRTLQEIPTLTGNPTLFVNRGEGEIYVDTLQDDFVMVSEMKAEGNAKEQAGMEESGVNATENKLILNKELPVREFLQVLQTSLSQNEELGFAGVKRLFAGKEFQKLLRGVIGQQWLVKPQNLKEEQCLNKLYEKMEREMFELEAAVKTTSIAQKSFLQTASDIRGNIEFMNQMNQIYNYVQIPLKMSGQNANGELYVYTNRKKLDDPEAELTAFLHLSMEHLGETDVSVRMKAKQVKTNFYFSDDASYRLVEKHLPVLEKRLKNKGYNCSFTISNEKRGVNFKENFVKKGKASMGSVHRYSFDVRA